jgi:hypothetical protein
VDTVLRTPSRPLFSASKGDTTRGTSGRSWQLVTPEQSWCGRLRRHLTKWRTPLPDTVSYVAGRLVKKEHKKQQKQRPPATTTVASFDRPL